MLTRLVINNFQAHAKLRIDLDPHVTTIIGPSDIGKTAILRALRWLCQNEPTGEAFLRTGADTVKVKLSVDGHQITRQRGKDGNLYALDDQEFKAFGTGIPASIAATLNVSSSNFSDQHSAAFWFSLSPPQLSRELNQVINLDAIDTVLEDVATQVRRAKSEWDVTKDRAEKAQTARAELSHIPAMVKELEALEEIEQRIADRATRIAQLRRLLERAAELQELAKAPAEAEAGLVALQGRLDRVRQAQDRAGLLRDLYRQAYAAAEHMSNMKGRLINATTEFLQYKRKLGVCPACGKPLTTTHTKHLKQN